MESRRLRWWVTAAWAVALATWLVLAGFTYNRFTIVFWVVTGLIATTIGTRPWWKAPLDWSPIVVFFLIYDYTRGAADRFGFPTWWEEPIAIDRFLGGGHVPTVWLQERLAAPKEAVPAWEAAPALIYLSYFVAPFVVGAALWMTSSRRFSRFMVRLSVVATLGLIGYVVVPAAPPWAAARCTAAEVADHPSSPPCLAERQFRNPEVSVLGRLDQPREGHSSHVSRITTRGISQVPGLHLSRGFIQTGIDESNPVAAIPSLHAAVTMLVSVTAWPLVRRRWRPLLALYPVAMAVTLVWGADHYVIDILIGWLVVAVAMPIATLLETVCARRLSVDEVATA